MLSSMPPGLAQLLDQANLNKGHDRVPLDDVRDLAGVGWIYGTVLDSEQESNHERKRSTWHTSVGSTGRTALERCPVTAEKLTSRGRTGKRLLEAVCSSTTKSQRA